MAIQHIQLDSTQEELLLDTAHRAGRPWPAVFQEALEAYRSRLAPNGEGPSETVFDLANRLGLVGCTSSGLTDLSTNPVHMEGFGESDK